MVSHMKKFQTVSWNARFKLKTSTEQQASGIAANTKEARLSKAESPTEGDAQNKKIQKYYFDTNRPEGGNVNWAS